jgi:hypothetical protein
MGSEPNVATVQLKLPFNTLKTNCPDAPKATLVLLLTEHVSLILQIVTYPSGRFVAPQALAAPANINPPIQILRSMSYLLIL